MPSAPVESILNNDDVFDWIKFYQNGSDSLRDKLFLFENFHEKYFNLENQK